MKKVSDWALKFRAQAEIYQVPGVSALAKDVHFFLLDHCNMKTGRCFPSEKRLARLVKKSDRSVRNAIHNLRDCGAIKVNARGGRNGTHQYELLLLERQKAAARPAEIRSLDRKETADKHKNKHIKEQAQIGAPDPLPSHELVKSSENIEAWYSLLGDMNIPNASQVIELTKTTNGYRLPSQSPEAGQENRVRYRAFFQRVIASKGACFGKSQ